MSNFPSNLNTLRKSRNLSLQELATRLNENTKLNFQKHQSTDGKKV